MRVYSPKNPATLSMTLGITVAIATCGRPESLRCCLQALAAQTRAPDEVIVVDQAPSPEARAVIAASGLAGLRYFEQPRIGLSASRNAAMDAAAQPILAVTDDDCFPDRNWVASLVQAFEREPGLGAVTGPIHSPPGEVPAGMYAISLRISPESRLFTGRVVPWTVGSGGNFAARIARLRELGGWDERLGTGSKGMAAEDCDIIDRMLSARHPILYESAALVHHDWQSRARRKSTRRTYAFGIGALCGLRLAAQDSFAWQMMAIYARRQLRHLAKAVVTVDREQAGERMTTLRSLLPGCIYGLRAKPRPCSGRRAREVILQMADPVGD